jgi:hypothetical protein
MTSVDLLLTEAGRLTTEVGRLDFYAVPVQKEDDFTSAPRNILSLADARTISVDLAHQVVAGRVGRYKWRKSTETADPGPRRDWRVRRSAGG